MTLATFSNENFDLFSGISEAKSISKGRPDLYHENLDFAEIRHYSMSLDEMNLKLRRAAKNQQERAVEALPEEHFKEDIEEKAAYQAMSLMNKYWMPTVG